MRRPARQPHDDHVLRFWGRQTRLAPGTEHVEQADAAQRRSTDAEKVTSRVRTGEIVHVGHGFTFISSMGGEARRQAQPSPRRPSKIHSVNSANSADSVKTF